MLRNQQLLAQILPTVQHQRLISQCNTVLCSKGTDIIRQGKIMKKLFDHRVSGSKKRWFPSTTDSTHGNNYNIIKDSHFGKSPNKGGKNAIRRMAVLNKLFMERITDLMATGEISERILGKGLQILRVKLSPDFAFINVFWVSNGDVCNDNMLERELQRSSGLLRHELSQLCLMGVVPRIKFVKDKFVSNMNQVQTLLNNIDFGSEEEADQEQIDSRNKNRAETLKQVFFGSKSNAVPFMEQEEVKENDNTLENSVAEIPEMRHDVFGLDHKGIMFKIFTKMRKSKYAWEQHLQNTSSELGNSSSLENSSTIPSIAESQLATINEKLAKAVNNTENFDAFLAQRKERRNTPERKKFRASDHNVNEANNTLNDDDYLELLMSKRQRELFVAEDYLLDDEEDRTHK